MGHGIGTMLAMVALLSLVARYMAAEVEQLGQLGGLVRLENEAVIARDSDEEKELRSRCCTNGAWAASDSSWS